MKKIISALTLGIILAIIAGCGGGGSKLPTYPNLPYGMCDGAFPDGRNPDQGAIADPVIAAQIMDTIRPYCSVISVYTCSPLKGTTESLPSLARKKGFSQIFGGSWIDGNTAASDKETDYQTAEIGKGNVDIAPVGYETQHFNTVTPQALIGYIRKVKAAGKPVAFCDTSDQVINHPEIVAEVSTVMFNKYPSWEGESIDIAFADFVGTYNAIKAKYPDKEIIAGEVGWPSDGNTVGGAVPSPANQLKYLEQILMWSNVNHVKVLWHEAVDEPYKAVKEGPLGAHWGLWTKDLVMKPGVLEVFKKTPVEPPIDTIPVINSGDSFFPEGNVTNTVKIPVDLSVASTKIVTVKYTSTDLTAVAGTDYTATSGTITFAPGTTNQFINLVVKGNTLAEPDKTLKVTFSEPANATLLHDSITLTIKNDDEAPLPTVSAMDVLDTGTPGAHTATVTLRLSAASTKSVSVDWATVNGTATAPTDFTAASGTATFSAGTTSKHIDLSIYGNWVIGTGRSFQVSLTNPVNATIATPNVNITVPNIAKPVAVSIDHDNDKHPLPVYGSLTGILTGNISGIDPANCKVACFLYINGGWWAKPYDKTPFSVVSPTGTWACNVVTGGSDYNAIRFAAYLLPKVDAAPLPIALGSPTIPAEIINASLAHDIVDRPKP